MSLQDAIVDFLSVLPDGNINYIIKCLSTSDISEIKSFVDDIKNNKLQAYFTCDPYDNSVYQHLLSAVKMEIYSRGQKIIDDNDKENAKKIKFNVKAEDYVPVQNAADEKIIKIINEYTGNKMDETYYIPLEYMFNRINNILKGSQRITGETFSRIIKSIAIVNKTKYYLMNDYRYNKIISQDAYFIKYVHNMVLKGNKVFTLNDFLSVKEIFVNYNSERLFHILKFSNKFIFDNSSNIIGLNK